MMGLLRAARFGHHGHVLPLSEGHRAAIRGHFMRKTSPETLQIVLI